MTKKREKDSKNPPKMRLVAVIIILGIGLYLNRSYAYFFNYLGRHQVLPVSTFPLHPYYLMGAGKVNDFAHVRYFALGDSLTRGIGVLDNLDTYPYNLAYHLSQVEEVGYTNLAVPGATTADLIADQLPQLGVTKAEYISLLIGTNDVLTAVSSNQFRSNYNQILDILVTDNPTTLIVINLPYLASSNIILPPYNYLVDWRTKQFNSIIEALVKSKQPNKTKIIYVDLYSQTKKPFSTDAKLYSFDQFHPSRQGYKLWSDIINANLNN